MKTGMFVLRDLYPLRLIKYKRHTCFSIFFCPQSENATNLERSLFNCQNIFADKNLSYRPTLSDDSYLNSLGRFIV